MVSPRRPAAPRLQVESLEGRVVLATAIHPLHAVAVAHLAPQVHGEQVHATAHKVAAASNPVLVNLTPTTTGITITSVTYDPRIHLITVKGTAAVNKASSNGYGYYPYVPSYPATGYIGVSATQAVNRFQSVNGYQYSNVTITSAGVVTVPFEGRVLATAGNFEAGTVNITVNSSDAYYNYTTLSVIARMRTAKAY